MLLSILKGAPLWVWPLLALLIYFGLKATRQRTSFTLPIYFLPLLAIISVNAVNSLPASNYVWLAFAITYSIGAWIGFGFQKTIVLEKSGNKAVLAGEWVTFTVLMIIFWMNFFGGVTKALSPSIYGSTIFHAIFAAVAAFAAGLFLGRAIRVFKHKSTPPILSQN